MARHLIVGSGPLGSSASQHLLALGHEVVVATRSGSGPQGVERVAIDATDTDRLAGLARGAASIINCANPPYHRWNTEWPPLAASLLDTAERSGARLVTAGNLYGYAAASSPMSATDPLRPPTEKGRVRVQMWNDAIERHHAGRIEAVEVRASDYVGPGLGDTAHLGARFVTPLLRGRSPRVVGRPDVRHSWTYVDDIGRVLAIAATDDRAPGRAWHVPTEPARSAQDMADAIADAAGVPRVRVKALAPALLAVAGWFSPTIREVRKMAYQFTDPFVIDATDTEETFGVRATPLAEQVAAIAAAARADSPPVAAGVSG